MKRIEVSIKPFEFEAVNESLADLGVKVTTVSAIQQVAPPNEPRRVYRGSTYATDFVTMLRLEVLVAAEGVSDVLEAVRRSAKSACREDAFVLVSDVGEAVRIESARRAKAAATGHQTPSGSLLGHAAAWQT